MSLTLNATNAMHFVERLTLMRNRPELRTPHGIALAVRTGLLRFPADWRISAGCFSKPSIPTGAGDILPRCRPGCPFPSTI